MSTEQTTTDKTRVQPAGKPRGVHTGAEAARDPNGRFLPGATGNPSGRPPGSRNRGNALVDELLESRARQLTRKAIEMALKGNVLALRLCLERLAPARRERAMLLELPPPASAEGISAGFSKVVDAMATGELTPSETNSAAELLESARRSLETTELARRIEEMEERLAEDADETAS